MRACILLSVACIEDQEKRVDRGRKSSERVIEFRVSFPSFLLFFLLHATSFLEIQHSPSDLGSSFPSTDKRRCPLFPREAMADEQEKQCGSTVAAEATSLKVQSGTQRRRGESRGRRSWLHSCDRIHLLASRSATAPCV